jgi:FkbM family methyltransferase
MILRNFEHHLLSCKGAIHVGGNVGEERNWYVSQKFTKVLWFEPNRALFPILESNLEEFVNHRAFNFGIHDTLKEATLNIASNAGQSSSILELGTHATNHPDVIYINKQNIRLIRLDDFFRVFQFNPADFNFLNVDVQGVELNVIKSLGELIKYLNYIYVEVNEEEVYKECCLLTDIDSYLSLYKFERVETKITKAKWGDALYVKK